MKKFLGGTLFFFKVVLLVLLLIGGWLYLNVTNLVKGKKSADTKGTNLDDLFGVNHAGADAPSTASPSTTPFLAYFDGKEYRLENDILFGRPKSNFGSVELGKQMYEKGMITPDLYKITAPLKTINGKLSFQIQEIEPEESFFKWLELRRIVHSARTEVVVDSEFKKFYVLDKKELEQTVMIPASIISREGEDLTKGISSPALMWDHSREDAPHIFFEKDNSIDVLFSHVRSGELPYLVVKSWYRDWVMGNDDDWQEKSAHLFDYSSLSKNLVRRAASVSLVALAAWVFHRRGIDLSPLAVPMFAGFGSGDHCFTYEFMDAQGNYQHTATLFPRTWKPNVEIVELPQEAVRSDNTVRVRVTATKRHAFGFIGLAQNIENSHTGKFEEEKLELSRARHNRLETDVRASLMNRTGGAYVHTIPGDAVDIEFNTPGRKLKEGERETYLIKSSGFYTPLRRESRMLAGNWQERISDEAKSRLASLTPLKNYKKG